tara:strand:+ start:123 stop:278 length:156 start_codon:yes stop_codon:yes gene_type:complete
MAQAFGLPVDHRITEVIDTATPAVARADSRLALRIALRLALRGQLERMLSE